MRQRPADSADLTQMMGVPFRLRAPRSAFRIPHSALKTGPAIAHDRTEDVLLGLRKNLAGNREQACCMLAALRWLGGPKATRIRTVAK
jgi:hypothetical protein